MVGTRSHAPPKPLDLSKHDQRSLRRLGRDLRDEIVGHYEDYLIRDRGNVSNWWTLVKSDGDVFAFREGKLAIERRKASASPRQPQAWMAARSTLPRVKVVGMIPGTLEDAMFAHAVHDSPSLRTFSKYQRDGATQSAVLNVVDEPTEDEPFTFCGVTWLLKAFPTSLVRDREGLTLSYSRLGVLSTGEPFGVVLTHSIVHDDRPAPLDENLVRADVSIAKVFRQASETHVEVFMMDFVDAKGALPESLQIHELGKTLLTVRRTTDTALNKKLCGRLVQRSRQRAGSVGGSSVVFLDGSSRCCEVCRRSLGGIFTSSAHKCQLCNQDVCGRCISTRELVVEAMEPKAVVKPFEFCVSCILVTQAVSSKDAARSAVRARATLQDPPSRTPSSSDWRRTSSTIR